MAERTSGRAPLWNFRVEKSLMRRFGRAVAKNGTNRTAVIRQLVLWYVHEDGATPVHRPDTPTPELPEDRDDE